MGSQASERFVGRADELAVVERLVDELETGRPAVLELRGEPGIGKTRLLRELMARADARRLLVLGGSGSELETDLPFSVFVDALDEYLRGLGERSLAALPTDVRAELAHVFPSLPMPETSNAVALQSERYRSHRAVRSLLEHLAAPAPLVLVLDDVHWADFASVELLSALLRRPPGAAVGIAVAMRPRQVPERLAVALERASRSGDVTRLELSALTSAEARELLGEGVDVAKATALYEESGGNPFYLEQLARAHRRGARAQGGGEVSGDVPSAVSAALSEELLLLSRDARLVLDAAAVAGDPFEPELAAAAADIAPEAAMTAVDELLRYDLVRSTEVPRRFRFRHPLVRHAVYEATAAAWRLGAHERCAAALDARGAPVTARAHHVERSAREGDAGAAQLLRAAGQETVLRAPASAARWFASALRLLPHTAPATDRIELLRSRAAALTATGRFADSHDSLVEALALVPQDSDELFAELTRACAAVESMLGRPQQAGDRLEHALARLEEPDSADGVALLLELAVNYVYQARYDAMREAGERALEKTRRLGDVPLTAGALAVLGFAESILRTPELAEAHRSEAAALIDSLSDDELARYVEAAAWLAGAELYLDRYVDADAHASRALALARATGQGELYLVLVEILGGVWRQRGKLAEAADLLDGGIEAARLLDNTHALSWTLAGRSTVALAAGDVELAAAAAAESVELTRASEATFHAAEAAACLASASLELGRPDTAVELLVRNAGGEQLTLIAGSPRAQYLDVLARSLLAVERSAEAAAAAEAARAWASSVDLPMAHAWANRAAAAVSVAAGEPQRAAEQAFASAAAADAAGAPVEAARSRVLAGRALALAGDRDRAVEELRAAAAELAAHGAARYRDEAERELGRLGHRPYRRTTAGDGDATGLDALTGRELQIARLVVERKTNPEIASDLFLSQKTVETHLRNIFRKLDVRSRVELARAVERAAAP